ncbi:MAG TPA: L,D-transpeptidase, partial [Verrucomicrobiales bacterium]|nr:L,D-transpeptidase [Verrucomicrobiales bacterium]
MKIEVSVPDQKLRLYEDSGVMVKEYACSTSRFGYSSEPGSNHTPLGKFRIAEM